MTEQPNTKERALLHRVVDQGAVVREYAVQWTQPDDVAGTVTKVTDYSHAQRILRIQRRLPGEMDGHVLSRMVLTTEWSPVDG